MNHYVSSVEFSKDLFRDSLRQCFERADKASRQLAQDEAKANMAEQGFVFGGDCLDALKYGLQAQLGKTQSISDAAADSTIHPAWLKWAEQVADMKAKAALPPKIIADKEPGSEFELNRQANVAWRKYLADAKAKEIAAAGRPKILAHIPIEEALPNRPCPYCYRNPSEPHHTYCRKFSPAKPETPKAAVAALAPLAKANAARFGCGRNV